MHQIPGRIHLELSPAKPTGIHLPRSAQIKGISTPPATWSTCICPASTLR